MNQNYRMKMSLENPGSHSDYRRVDAANTRATLKMQYRQLILHIHNAAIND